MQSHQPYLLQELWPTAGQWLHFDQLVYRDVIGHCLVVDAAGVRVKVVTEDFHSVLRTDSELE